MNIAIKIIWDLYLPILYDLYERIHKQVKQFWAAQCLTMDGASSKHPDQPWSRTFLRFSFPFYPFWRIQQTRRSWQARLMEYFKAIQFQFEKVGYFFAMFVVSRLPEAAFGRNDHCEAVPYLWNFELLEFGKILKYSSVGIICSVIIEITKSFDKFKHIVPLVSIHPPVWRCLNIPFSQNYWFIFRVSTRSMKNFVWTRRNPMYIRMNSPLNIH